jgi:GAF domain-containing protein
LRLTEMSGQMNTDRSGALDCSDASERLEIATDALAELRGIFAGEEPLKAALDRVATGAARVIPDADAVTITVLTPDGPDSVAWTDQTYLALDAAQYGSGRGPCLESAVAHRPVRAATAASLEQWPEFCEAAEQAGIKACLAVPLLLETTGAAPGGPARPAVELVGALNLYSHSSNAYDPFDEALMRLFSTEATLAISNARRWQSLHDHVRNLETALISRAEIDQAKGVLMAIHQYSAEEAFAMLVEQSQNRNVKVRRIAQELLDSIRKPS